MFEIRRYTSELADEWNQFVAESKNGTFLFDRRYMDYHSDRFSDYSLLFYIGNRLLAVLPAHSNGDTLCSHNGLTYGGLVMSSRLTVAQTMNLFRELNELLRQEGFRHVSYKCIPWIYHRLSAEEDLYALYHECRARIVARDFATNIFLSVGMRWDRVRRRGVIRATKAGVSIECSDDYSAFWDVLAQNLLSKYGVKPVPQIISVSIRPLRVVRCWVELCSMSRHRWFTPSTVLLLLGVRNLESSICFTIASSAITAAIPILTLAVLPSNLMAAVLTSNWCFRRKDLEVGDCVTIYMNMTYDKVSRPEGYQPVARR